MIFFVVYMSSKRPLGPPSGILLISLLRSPGEVNVEKPHRGSLCYSTKMSRRKRYLQSSLKTLVLNRVFSNPGAPYVSQLLFTRIS